MKVLDIFNFHIDGRLKIIGILLTLSSIAGFFHFGLLYYVSLALFGMILLKDMMKKGFTCDFFIFSFLIVCLLSLVVNDPPSYFNAWARFGVYVLVLFVVSPMVSSTAIKLRRKNLLLYVMDVCIILSVLSFFCYFLGINLFVRGGELLEIGVGKFSGLMNHSMVLGPISGLSTIVMLVFCLFERRRRKRYRYIAAAFCCFGSCLLSSSRIAVSAAILGGIYVLFMRFRGNLSKFFKIFMLVLIVGGLSFPIWGGLTDFVMQKQEGNIEMGGSMLYSRERKINARIAEFSSSPIIGIGFATVNPKLDVVDFSNGQIEPGTSWLAVLSMTGLLGFAVFLAICYSTLKRLQKIASTGDVFNSCALGGMFVYFLFHLSAEGYIMAPRSFLNMLFWLILGAIYEESKVSNKYLTFFK